MQKLIKIIETQFNEFLSEKGFLSNNGTHFYRVKKPIIQLIRIQPDDEGKSISVFCSESVLFANDIEHNFYQSVSNDQVSLMHSRTGEKWTLGNKKQIENNCGNIIKLLTTMLVQHYDHTIAADCFLSTKYSGRYGAQEIGLIEKICLYCYSLDKDAVKTYTNHLALDTENLWPSDKRVGIVNNQVLYWKKQFESKTVRVIKNDLDKVISHNLELLGVNFI